MIALVITSALTYCTNFLHCRILVRATEVRDVLTRVFLSSISKLGFYVAKDCPNTCQFTVVTGRRARSRKERNRLEGDFPIVASRLTFQAFLGSWKATYSPTHARESKTAYANCPPKILFCREKAKSDAAAAGPTARCVETTVCARPFMEPRERLFGTAEETNMNIEPNAQRRTQTPSMPVDIQEMRSDLLNPKSETDIDTSCSTMSGHTAVTVAVPRANMFSSGNRV